MPFEVRRLGHAEAESERRELLSLAHAVATELASCRVRIERAEKAHVGWFEERKLPATAYDRWAKAEVTADQSEVNGELRSFYVWADDMNHKMSRTVAAEWNAIGTEINVANAPLLGADTVVPAMEGLELVTRAQDAVDALIKRRQKVGR